MEVARSPAWATFSHNCFFSSSSVEYIDTSSFVCVTAEKKIGKTCTKTGVGSENEYRCILSINLFLRKHVEMPFRITAPLRQPSF